MIPELPRGAWTLLAGGAVSAVGNGLTFPFLLVYLHEVRGLGLAMAGLVLSTLAFASFAGNPIGGSLTDRVGAQPVVAGALVCSAAGSALLALAATPLQAFAATATLGFGNAVAWPARTALLATLVPGERRSSAYALEYWAANIGFGAGALLAAMVVDVSSPTSFQALYLLDSVSFLAVVPMVLRLSVSAGAEAVRPRGRTGALVGYREIVRDRAFLGLWALTALIVAFGYAQYSTALPAFATSEGDVATRALGFAFAANTAAVVILQLPMLRWLRGRRRTGALSLAFAATGTAWMIVLAGGAAPSAGTATLLFTLAMVVLAVGETAYSPSAPALVNDLAPDSLRGRYNGVYTLASTTGVAAGPAIAGALLAAGHADGLMLGLIAACAIGAAGSLWLARHVPRGLDLVDAAAA